MIGVGAAVVALIGGIPAALGLGWFGTRLLADDVTVWVLNTSGQDLTVEIAYARTLESRAGTLEMVQTLEGPSTIRATDGSGQVVDDVTFTAANAVLYNAGGSECLAVFDVSEYYTRTQNPQLTLVDRIPETQRLYEFKAPNMILPRRGPPQEVAGAVHWIEDVACSALDPAREEELLFFATNRLHQRHERAQQEAAQRAAGQ